tara:strand:- start:224 stop:472 length:249 start_codon:yes stop_codon:yes gene_type:complete
LILHIGIDELELENSDSWKLNHLYNVGIDYETNRIEGLFTLDNKEIILFDFSRYDMKLSNRWGDYKISVGEAGITLDFIGRS